MLQIFLAYDEADEAAALRLYTQLQQKGYSPWLKKKDLLPGQTIETVVQNQIRESQVCIACLSARSLTQSGYVQQEFKMALSAHANRPPGAIYLIPLRLDDCEIPELRHEQTGVRLCDIQWVDFFEEDGFERLLQALRHGFPASHHDQSSVLAVPVDEDEAHRLHNVLQQLLAACEDEREQEGLAFAIRETLRQCNPDADLDSDAQSLAWSDQLRKLGTDLPPALDWKTEGNLVRFAVELATRRREQLVSKSAYESLKTWVNEQGFNFSTLLERVVDETPTPSVAGLPKQNFVVSIEGVSGSLKKIRVSMWAIADRDRYDLKNPPLPILLDEEKDIEQLPLLIREKVRDRFLKARPVIHLFIPPAFLSQNIEMRPSTTRGHRVLGREYPFVLRLTGGTLPNTDEDYYQADWQDKWTDIEQFFGQRMRVSDVFEVLDCSLPEDDLLDDLEPAKAAILGQVSDIREPFELAAEEEIALPVALWVRGQPEQVDLSVLLEGSFDQLLERIRQARETAHKSKVKTSLGYNLGLVWEDSKIVPPTHLPIGQEAC